jgi:hypothetical protein
LGFRRGGILGFVAAHHDEPRLRLLVVSTGDVKRGFDGLHPFPRQPAIQVNADSHVRSSRQRNLHIALVGHAPAGFIRKNIEWRSQLTRQKNLTTPVLKILCQDTSLSCDNSRKVFQFSDMENGAAGEILGKSLRIQIQPNLNSILADKSHVVIGNVMVRAVRKADSERLERRRAHQFTNLRCCNHSLLDS